MKQKSARASKREQLIQTAVTLFAQNGIHATGIDTIVEQSGVTKKTLYAHFRSKEELVLAALRHYDGQLGIRSCGKWKTRRALPNSLAGHFRCGGNLVFSTELLRMHVLQCRW